MRNFRNLLLFLFVWIVFEAFFSFALEPVTYGYYVEKDLEALREQGREPDMVFIGDSQIYRTFIPSIFEQELEDISCVLNAGTGSQTIKETYFYLKDLLQQYSLKKAVVGLDYICFQKQEEDIQGTILLLERLKSPVIKLEALRSTMTFKDLPYLLKSYQYRGNFADIPKNIKTKFSADVRNGIDTREGEHYENQGFVASESIYRDGEVGIPEEMPWLESQIDEEAFAYLDKIVELCQESGTELYFVTGPTSLSAIYAAGNYEEAYRCLSSYAEEKGISYVDINLLKDRRNVLRDSVMRDANHVSRDGARAVSGIYAELLKEESRNGQMDKKEFFHSVEEMKREFHQVIGCAAVTEAAGETREIIASSLCGTGVQPEYEFKVSRDGTNWDVIQEYSEKSSCLIPESYCQDTFWFRVNCRAVGSIADFEAFRESRREKE